MVSGDQLVGRWGLTAWRTRIGEDVVQPLGDQPRGVLLYTSDGWMSVHIAGPDRAPIDSIDPLGGSEQEQAAAYASFLAYCGRYRVEGDAVIHSVELSSYPNWVGQEQRRIIDISDGGLVLRTPPIESPAGVVVSELHWMTIRLHP